MHMLKSVAAASALALLPFAAGAATLLTAGNPYTQVGTLVPGGTLTFMFEVAEDLDIDFFSISATGTNAGNDLQNVRFDYDVVTDDTFDTIQVAGNAAAGFDFVPGFGPYTAGDMFSFTFKDGIRDDVGITLSFETIAPSAVPVPAAGGLLGAALIGAGIAARRRSRADA